MPWARLDDSMLNHPKLLECSPTARWLFVATILYCRQNQTAGALTRGQMASHLRGQGCQKKHLDELVKSGLVDDIDYGYEVHHYEDFNPLTSTERVRRHRSLKREESVTETFHGVSETPPHARATAPGPVPQPQPVPGGFTPLPLNPLSPEALAICQAFEARGQGISERDKQDAEGMVSEFRIPTADEFAEEIRTTDQERVALQLQPLRRVMGYRERFRRLNDRLRDEGRRPRESEIRSSGGMTAIASIVGKVATR